MILQEYVDLPAPADRVRHQLLEYLFGAGLHAASSAAYEEGEALLMRAGAGGVTKKLAVLSLAPYQRGETTVVPIRWEATGPLGDLFPTLDANIEIDPEGAGTRLTLVGSYQPPLGRLGARLDQLLLHQVARATARSFLTRLEGVVSVPAPEQASTGTDQDGERRPDRETDRSADRDADRDADRNTAARATLDRCPK